MEQFKSEKEFEKKMLEGYMPDDERMASQWLLSAESPTEILDKLIAPEQNKPTPFGQIKDLRLGKLDDRRYKIELIDVMEHLELGKEAEFIGASQFAKDMLIISLYRLNLSVSSLGYLIDRLTGKTIRIEREKEKKWRF